ncbi:hypothetical protein QW180_20135 [Vibrio sinaloensis]|nr:hypothetical protein [Vibrio sinaloensis]
MRAKNGDSFATLDFSIVSGEVGDKPTDDSESLTVILSEIPPGVVIEDSDGTQLDLNFVGYDVNGQPTYEANITDFNTSSGIIVRPVDSSTEKYSHQRYSDRYRKMMVIAVRSSKKYVSMSLQ